jgi:DNA gyrase subunit A
VRDGLKPVHRRILWTCHENGFTSGKAYRKSARIVGDVMGNITPMATAAIYDALARMTQDWSMRLPLIDGQGNFGSMDPDPPASMRYTEARLAGGRQPAPTSTRIPSISSTTTTVRRAAAGPARALPQSAGQRRGRHRGGHGHQHPAAQSGRSDRRCLATMETRITTDELMQIIPGPDFPTAPLILGQGGARNAYNTGRGSILMRARHEIETGRGDRRSIVLTSIPYQVGKNGLVEKIAEAAKDKRIEGISDIRDESNREGVRVVDLKRDATPEVVLNQIWRNTPRSRPSRPTCWRSVAVARKCWASRTSSPASSASVKRSSPAAPSSS